ncbi:MFS general substrate transporter [Anaeromyces robustus]|uniref:MFS general substrate transporter n=1 Tax=Anaeromyces robustus TaxID=1754192 RepID=A0A1Y1UVY3_9FUNG|nr:MFS general substrate transporter [Anaeromyces robustus]|eukprot:ORX41778.1 MFS general substrate transporter [Anaeromyces robustus]
MSEKMSEKKNDNKKLPDNFIKSEGKKVSPRRRLLIFLNLNVSCVATSMLGTALTTALPPIMEDLNMTVNTAQWLTSGFILFLAVMTPFTAYLITRFKTKRLYCIALLFFILGLTVCAFAKSFAMMMLGRIIQGCGNGLISSMGQVIILSIFPPEKIGTVMGWYGLSIGVAPIISPTIAGLLVDSVGWRMIFVIAISIMAISLIIAFFVFEDVLPTMRKKFDVISLFFSALAFGGVTFAVGNMGTYKFVSYEVLMALIIGLVTAVIFTFRQLKIKVPFLDVRVLKNWDYTVSLTATVLIQLIFMGTTIIIPVYVQQLKGLSATISGLVTLPGSLVWAIISPFAGKIYDKVGMKLLFIVGSVILIFSNLGIYFIDIHQSVWIFSGINVFRCLACGSILMPLVTWAMKDIPKMKTSDATALYNSIRFIAGAVGSALFISVMTKIANGVRGSKENPEMYGINVVFLIMSILSGLLLLIGIFGCKDSLFKKKPTPTNNDEDNKKNEEKEKEKDIKKIDMTQDKDISEVRICIDDEDIEKINKTLENISYRPVSEGDTVIENGLSLDGISIKDKSDVETVIENQDEAEIDVVVNTSKQ